MRTLDCLRRTHRTYRWGISQQRGPRMRIYHARRFQKFMDLLQLTLDINQVAAIRSGLNCTTSRDNYRSKDLKDQNSPFGAQMLAHGLPLATGVYLINLHKSPSCKAHTHANCPCI